MKLFTLLAVCAMLCSAVYAQSVRTTRDVVYGQGGGRDLIMHVVEADDGVDFKPAMVFIHGGGWSEGSPDSHLGLAEEMAREGFKCFSIEYRLTGEAPWPAQIEDCKTAIRHIRANAKKYGINPNRIGAMGHSAGGQLSCMLGTLKPGEYEGTEKPGVSSQVQAVVNYCGPEDFGYYIEHTEKPMPPTIRRCFAGLFDGTAEGREYWIPEASPISHVSRSSAPHFIIHGTKDDLVWYEMGEAYRDKLRAKGVRADWLSVKDAGHAMDFSLFLPQVKEFCREVLLR